MKINIASNEVVHFIGIGGIGMSGLAQIMNNMGFTIQGSDLNRNKNTDRLIKKGITREDSYALVQKNAMKSWDEGSNFLNNLKKDSNVMKLISESELETLFDLDKVLVNINKIFERLKLV